MSTHLIHTTGTQCELIIAKHDCNIEFKKQKSEIRQWRWPNVHVSFHICLLVKYSRTKQPKTEHLMKISWKLVAIAVEEKSQGSYFVHYWSAIDSMTISAMSSDSAHRNVSQCAGKHINILSGNVSRGSTCSNVRGLFEGDIHISTPILTSPTLPSYALITHL